MRRLAPLAASFLGGVVGAVTFLAVIGAKPATRPNEIHAKKILADSVETYHLSILDGSGESAGNFFSLGGAVLTVGNPLKGPSVTLGAGNGSAEVDVSGPNDKAKFVLEFNQKTGCTASLEQDGRKRIVLGKAGLITKSSGVTEETPPGSIVVFDEVGNVVWKMPQ